MGQELTEFTIAIGGGIRYDVLKMPDLQKIPVISTFVQEREPERKMQVKFEDNIRSIACNERKNTL